MRLKEPFRTAVHALREDIHRAPELSRLEFGTQARIDAWLRDFGVVGRSVGGTGLVADVVGDPRGPRVCVRGDMDALPVDEATGAPFASTVPGVAHACGHDVHAAAACGAVALLAGDPPAGVIRVLLQPAEEHGTGAAACVADGAMDGVDAVLGGHLDLDYAIGTVALQAGPMCASTDQFRVVVRGRGSHAARPQLGVDAVLCGARIVDALQGIVAREVEPGQPAVITVGAFHGGERSNILADRAVLDGTIRCCDPSVRDQLKSALHRVVAGVAAASGASAEVGIREGHDPVVNDPDLAEVVAAALRDLGLRTVRLARPNTGGEDFSDLLRGRRGVYVRWGSRGPGSGDGPAHSGRFLPDAGVLDIATLGLAASARAVVSYLRE